MRNIKSLHEFINVNESKEIELTFDSKTNRKSELEEFKSQINNIDKSIKVDINGNHNSILIRTHPKFVDSIEKLSKSFEVDNVSESVLNEASVQVAGHGKPSGAKVLATVIIDMLDKQDFLHEDVKKSHKQLIDMVANVIMDSTF